MQCGRAGPRDDSWLEGCEQTTRNFCHISQESVQMRVHELLHLVFSHHGSHACATQPVGGEATDKGHHP